MTLQIELKDDKIVRMTEVGHRLRIEYKWGNKEMTVLIPMSIIQAFGEVKTPLEMIKEVQP